MSSGFYVWILMALFIASHASTDAQSVSEVLDGIFKGYDQRVRPNFGGPPLNVGITMYVLEFPTFCQTHEEFTIDAYFRQSWTDTRLSFAPRKEFQFINLSQDPVGKMWTPDTFIVNSRNTERNNGLTPSSFVRIGSNGDVLWSTRVAARSSCPMSLRAFPHDNHKCRIEFESYGSNANDINYVWAKGLDSVGVAESKGGLKYRASYVDGSAKCSIALLGLGNYSRCSAEFAFERRSVSNYWMYYYVPCAFAVFLAWISVYLHESNQHVRLSFAFVSLLVVAAVMTSAAFNFPQTSYLKCIEVYILFSLVMSVFALTANALQIKFGNEIESTKSQVRNVFKIFHIVFVCIYAVFQLAYWISVAVN